MGNSATATFTSFQTSKLTKHQISTCKWDAKKIKAIFYTKMEIKQEDKLQKEKLESKHQNGKFGYVSSMGKFKLLSYKRDFWASMKDDWMIGQLKHWNFEKLNKWA